MFKLVVKIIENSDNNINLMDCGITDKVIPLIVETISKKMGMIRVNMYRNNITELGATMLLGLQNIEYLNLGYNNIKESKELHDMIQNSKIKTIIFNDNPITREENGIDST
ncbi:Leucine-rich repeat-containing protein [Orpheovirus IHUMI-LCC2]|uniref:Leucine-rich repeat-containing protein n=1 Tax=Orpheovirus IHUMI-LCC2 TaxID=2023057 RepID=A0A2I2L677_9VIRU|nr:Leucine-rich repeat-containing protein [Orpheovirus IHUMI-LCC2]SNW63016.1 Leucine-rich repeat-containing protein [Orpheovirus IHUMI-LCC2]